MFIIWGKQNWNYILEGCIWIQCCARCFEGRVQIRYIIVLESEVGNLRNKFVHWNCHSPLHDFPLARSKINILRSEMKLWTIWFEILTQTSWAVIIGLYLHYTLCYMLWFRNYLKSHRTFSKQIVGPHPQGTGKIRCSWSLVLFCLYKTSRNTLFSTIFFRFLRWKLQSTTK